MRVVILIPLLVLAACNKTVNHPSGNHDTSLEERVRQLQGHLDAGSRDPIAAERQTQQDAEEIASFGLTERAWHEFGARLPGAQVKQWSIGYFMTKDTVWCDFRYVTAPASETKQKEFGFRRTDPTSWQILWEESVAMDTDVTQ